MARPRAASSTNANTDAPDRCDASCWHDRSMRLALSARATAMHSLAMLANNRLERRGRLSNLRQHCRFPANRAPIQSCTFALGSDPDRFDKAGGMRNGNTAESQKMGVSHDSSIRATGIGFRTTSATWPNSAKAGEIDRREFLALASVFGASTAMAYGMIGLAAPTPGARPGAQEGRRDQGFACSSRTHEGPAHL